MTAGTDLSGYGGQLTPQNSAGTFNSLYFIVWWMLSEVRTIHPVQVIAVTNSGGVSEVGFVDVVPLVKQMDGNNLVTDHGTVSHIPYFRVQGGTNAIIIDPVVGDKGIMACADRDISSVKATKAAAPPGSQRRFDFADGLYIGGFLNGVPTQYIRFTDDGITVADKNGNQIVMGASGITINGVLFDASGNISGAGTVMATGEGTFGGHTVGLHTHISAGPGSPTSGPTG